MFNEEQKQTQQNSSEAFRALPNSSETFGMVPKDSEGFPNIPKVAERRESHTLTVREAARMFEAAGVARTERSIVNWCQLNAQGQARLDAYFDPNERKYYITPESVDRAVREEIARAAKGAVVSGGIEVFPKGSEEVEHEGHEEAVDNKRIKELESEVLDLKITNRAKEIVIQQLQGERGGMLDQLLIANRKVGELETKLLQLESPDSPATQLL